MMAKEMQRMLGKEVLVRFGGLLVRCIVVNARSVFGKTQLLVSPVCGAGEEWVASERLREVESR